MTGYPDLFSFQKRNAFFLTNEYALRASADVRILHTKMMYDQAVLISAASSR